MNLYELIKNRGKYYIIKMIYRLEMLKIRLKKRKKQSTLNDDFVYDVFVFLFIGLLLCNSIRLISLWRINELNTISPFFFSFPPLLLILIIRIFHRKITTVIEKSLKQHSIKSVYPVLLVGLIHTFASIPLLGMSITHFGLCGMTTIISCIILYFNGFREYDEHIRLLRRDNDSNKIKMLYDDFRMWIREIIHLVIYFSIVIGAILAIVWGFTPGAGFVTPEYQADYQRVVSAGIILVYAYMLVGLLTWIYKPIIKKMKLIRNISFRSQT